MRIDIKLKVPRGEEGPRIDEIKEFWTDGTLQRRGNCATKGWYTYGQLSQIERENI